MKLIKHLIILYVLYILFTNYSVIKPYLPTLGNYKVTRVQGIVMSKSYKGKDVGDTILAIGNGMNSLTSREYNSHRDKDYEVVIVYKDMIEKVYSETLFNTKNTGDEVLMYLYERKGKQILRYKS